MSTRIRSRRAPVSTDKRFRKNTGGGDTGTPERWQHSGRVFEFTERAGVLAARATEEHILDVLALRRLLNKTQLEAGLKFKADYHAASLSASVTSSYNGASSARDFFHGEYERNETQEAAYRRWRQAVKELGSRDAAAVISVVCHDAPPQPRDVSALQNGLQKLVIIYRLAQQDYLQPQGK